MSKPIGRMTPMSVLISIGACVTFASIVLSNPPPTSGETSDFEECEAKFNDQIRLIGPCYSKEFTEEEMNETRRIYNDANCIYCKNYCRKQDAIISCVTERAEPLKNVSNKARQLVPLVKEMVEAGVSAMCENDAKVLYALRTGEVDGCLRSSLRECDFSVKFLEEISGATFCDSPNPENDPYTANFVCQQFIQFLECAEKGVSSCSMDDKAVVDTLMSKLRSVESCAKYY